MSVPVENLYAVAGPIQEPLTVNDAEVRRLYGEMHAYAASKDNFAPQVRAAIMGAPVLFPAISKDIVWVNAQFISDFPGKNPNRRGLGGGGRTSLILAKLVETARHRIVIQSPYLVMSDEAKRQFKAALQRGVKVRINTNSLSTTDNLLAFSGYRNQRDELLAMGVEVFEYKTAPAIQREMMQNSPLVTKRPPVFSIHAKSMVVDGETVFIGTFNFDPRSQNLNTEAGVIIQSRVLAEAVESAIEVDMLPENSWRASENPDQYASIIKRAKVRLWQTLPIEGLL